MRLTRSDLFALTVAIGFLLPVAIPGVGLFIEYLFIMVIVLLAWFMIKWGSVKAITARSGRLEMTLGLLLIGADYAFNAWRASSVGLIDLNVIFIGAIIFAFGVRSFKIFWVPVAYGLILLAGYQIEAIVPNYAALQNWLASVMVQSVNALGIRASVSGDLVTMYLPNGSPIFLEVSGACTGLQGILAFGVLSSMSLIDLKLKVSRLVPIFTIGFLGAFLINILRLLVVFLTFEYFGLDAGTTMHVYFGYLLFVGWVLAFWALAFRYLVPSNVTTLTTMQTAKLGQHGPT